MIAAVVLAALGFSPATAHRIDEIVVSEMHAHRAAGIAVGVVESGRVVYARGYGQANLSRHIPVSPGTQFEIGQISEQFTAAAILLLAQENKLSLDDAVTKYLPQLTVAHYVTIRELLEQTSGLPLVSDWPHLLRAADTERPIATPGAAYMANPLNYVVAGRIVEQVTGDTSSDFVEQHVFVPLVMDATLYAGESGASTNRAVGYTVEGGKLASTTPWSAARLGSDAGVVSDVYDLAKWDIEFPILLRVDAVRDMFTPGVPDAFELHGMGWTIDARSGHPFMWQNGQVPGFHAMNAILPDDHVAVVVLSNTDALHGASAMPEVIAGRILDAVVPPSPRRVDNGIVVRARLLLAALQADRLDRTELTPAFSRYLSDTVVREAHLASLGRLLSLVPISSTAERGGNTTYEFLALFAAGERHYRMTLTPDGKVASISFSP